jgi:hypothetical protein
MHCQLFRPVTSATATFSSNHFQLLPLTAVLCRLTAMPQVRNNNVEVHLEDFPIYNTSKKLEAAAKLFTKQGRSKATQEEEVHSDDE